MNQISGSGAGFGFSGPEIIGTGIERDWARSDAATARQSNERAQESQQDFQHMMSSTAYQRAVADMKAAGLNPMLAVSQGGASSAPGSGGHAAPLPHKTSAGGSMSVTGGPSSAAAIALTNALKDKTDAETVEVEARTPVHAANIAQIKQSIEQSIAQTKNIIQQEKTGVSTAALADQQAENLKETIPQIRATVNQLKALTAHSTADIARIKSTTGLQEAEIKEINAKLAANLPQLERAIKEIEKYHLELANAPLEARADVRSGFTGRFMEVLNGLIPFQGILLSPRIGPAAQPPKYQSDPGRNPHSR